MKMPEPVEEGAVKFRQVQSTARPDRLKTIVELDYGKTNLTLSQASNIDITIINLCRVAFGVSLRTFR